MLIDQVLFLCGTRAWDGLKSGSSTKQTLPAESRSQKMGLQFGGGVIFRETMRTLWPCALHIWAPSPPLDRKLTPQVMHPQQRRAGSSTLIGCEVLEVNP